MITQQGPFSLAFQITQQCPFECDICHRRYEKGQGQLSQEERKRMVDILRKRGLRRLTVTGGEPTLLGEKLFDFLRYVHQKQIHVCLSTNGYKLNEARIEEMDGYVDQLLFPIRSLTRSDWQADFGNTPHLELFETAIHLLQWIKTTGIILEVSTVVHRENIDKIIDLGWQLVSLNPNIVWRLEEYYAMGFRVDLRSRFEIIGERDFDLLYWRVRQNFGHLFKSIRPGKGKNRVYSPDFLITPTAELVTTSNNRYGAPTGNILKEELPPDFKNLHPWPRYREVCRDWGWGDL